MYRHGKGALSKHHVKARCKIYPGSTNKERFPVPDENVPWREKLRKYEPLEYTAPEVEQNPPWADPDFTHAENKDKMPKWNCLDGKINRESYDGHYDLDPESGVPRNPRGRTGMAGRGLLGRWGPNHAADPIVTRWKRDNCGKKVQKDSKPLAQFIAVQRRGNNEWALPGGMVDAGEVISAALKREFGEEALNSLETSPEEKDEIEKHMNELFQRGTQIYRGYVDDPRNTDNAWMETTAILFRDDDGDSVAKFKLHAGDDAVGVQWLDLDSSLQLYANHVDFLKKTAEILGASW
ncbi:ADP-ribose pyrophosphatase, mitochondrial-like [Littorina saxatilis]|uniref:Nudix hydrolase domain-containing protein n=1 Tax=Littorina saxatilis TaxID=31220 RepID=A0AAN9BF18_9CAEN